MESVVIVAGIVTISARVIAMICGELSEKEKEKDRQRKKEYEEIERKIQQATADEKGKNREENQREILKEKTQYIESVIDDVRERITEREDLKREIEENIKAVRSAYKDNTITQLRKSSLEKLLRQLYESKEKCYSYIIYLKKYLQHLEMLAENVTLEAEVSFYSMKLPDDFPYTGKIISSLFTKKQLLKRGKIPLKSEEIQLYYEVLDTDLLDEWDDDAYIPVLVERYDYNKHVYPLSIEKGMFYSECLENTRIGVECEVAKVSCNATVLKYKKNLLVYMPNSYLDNPNKKPPIRTVDRVFACRWDYGMGDYRGISANQKGNDNNYAITVAENQRFAAASVGFEHIPMLFSKEKWFEFAEFLTTNSLFDEEAEWKIGLVDEEQYSLEDGRKIRIQLGDLFMIIASVYLMQIDGNNTVIAQYEEAFIPQSAMEKEKMFQADDIFVAVDCDFMPVVDDCKGNFENITTPEDVSMFWIECFSELKKQREIKKSQFGMRYFQQWGEITEKLILYLKKGEKFSLKIRKQDISEEKNSTTIKLQSEIWEQFKNKLQHYINKQSVIKDDMLFEYYIIDKKNEYIKAKLDFDAGNIEIFQKDYEISENVELQIRNPFVRKKITISVVNIICENNKIRMYFENIDGLKKQLEEIRQKAQENRLKKLEKRLEFVVEDMNKQLFDATLLQQKQQIQILGKYSAQNIDDNIELFIKEVPNAEIKQISAYRSFKVGQMQNSYLQSFLLDGNNVVESINGRKEIPVFLDKSLNDMQAEALKKAFLEDNFFMIQGPPGTGKTTVIKKLIKEALRDDPTINILVASQANVAVDNVLKGLIYNEDRSFKNYKKYIVRCGNEKKIDPTLKDVSLEFLYDTYLRELDERKNIDYEIYEKWKTFLIPYKGINADIGELLIRKKSIVGATCVGISKKNIGLERESFDLVIIDEAGKALPMELMIPIVRAKKLILIGDHKQLPPVINPALYDPEKIELDNRNFAQNELFENSYFEKLYNSVPESNKVMLNTQYRMPALIGTMVSELFYNGELLNGENTISKKTIFHKKNLVFYDMVAVSEYKESVENKNVYNKYEAAFVCKLIRKLREKDKETRIAVITPYKGQKRKILTRMLQEEINTKLTVCDTVDSFQGDEAEVVIFCMTRSQKPTRYFNDNRRLNVAFSRAKNELIIIGNRKYFKKFNSEKSVMPQIGKYIYDHGQIIVEQYDETLVNKKLNSKKMVLNLSSIIINQEYDGNIDDSKVDRYLEEYHRYNKITSPIRVKRVETRYYLVEGIEIYTACELMEQQECCCIEIE